MTQNPQKYPIGIQTFPEVIETGSVYIDKTDYVWRMTHGDMKYIFLSRPRRFGKSLLVSTLQAYFEGRKELFNGLAIEKLETEWTTYPVLHFDFSADKYNTKEDVLTEIEGQLTAYEAIFGRESYEVKISQRLSGLIKRASKQTGRKVVVLIDEYDAPMLDVLHDADHLEDIRFVMRRFFSPLKSCDPWLRYVFLTGITKFPQLSIFSELNNITDISMYSDFAAICGITEEEMTTCLRPGIEVLSEANDMTVDEALRDLKTTYDGYHFTWPSPDLYNPYSLFRSLQQRAFGSYWFGSGTPTFLIHLLRRYGTVPSELSYEGVVSADDFNTPVESATSELPILYQSGYLTIKSRVAPGRYILDMPNQEVRLGLMTSLVPAYLTPHTKLATSAVWDISQALRRDDMNAALERLQQFLLTIPYASGAHTEGHYQQVFYIIFTLIGEFVDTEVRTPRGRVDVVLRTPARLYVIELKMNRDAATAMTQIEEKNYVSRFALAALPVTKVAVNFDSQQRTISDWQIK